MKASMETDQSAWSKFIQLVARLFGIDNVLFHTLSNADILFSARSDNSVTNGNDLLWAPERYDVSGGKFKLNPGERSKFLSKLIQNRTKWKDLDKTSLGKFFTSLSNQYRKYLLGALSVDQLADIYGDNMPQLKEYVKEVDKMIATRNAILKEGDPIITHWSNLLNENPKKAEQLGNVMIQATLDKTDPDPKSITYDPKDMAKNPALKTAWQDMASGKDGDIAVQIYRQVREFYERRMNEYVQVQLLRIAEYGKAKGLSDEEIAKKQLEFKKDTEEKIIRPYFPIKRFGDYWLQVGKGKSKIFMQFEDAAARNAELDKFKERIAQRFVPVFEAKGMTPDEAMKAALTEAEKELDAGQGFSESLSGKLADLAQLQRIHDLINETSDNVALSTDPKIQADPLNSLRAALQDQFDQMYIELQPEQSIQKMFMHRDNIAGPSQDMLRAFSVSRQRVAYQRARFQHMPQLFNIVEAARMRVKDKNIPLEERKRLGDYLHELERNLREAVLEPPKQSWLTTMATNFGFLQFLSAPASAVINAMAIPGIYTPIAGAKYGGVKNVTTTMSRYARMLGGTGLVSDETGRYEFLSLSRAQLDQKTSVGTDDDSKALPQGKTLADVYNEGVARGIINVSQSHEAANIGEEPSNEYTGRWNKIMYYVSLPFHAAEKFNREVVAMSAFELAYERNLKNKMKPELAFEKAVDTAKELTYKSMFDYSTLNKPRYFQSANMKVIMQFKQFSQQMTYMLARSAYEGFYKKFDAKEREDIGTEINSTQRLNGEQEYSGDALQKQIDKYIADLRKEGKKRLMGTLGMTFAFAGTTGLPGWWAFSKMMEALHAVFGDDDEEDKPFNLTTGSRTGVLRHSVVMQVTLSLVVLCHRHLV